MKRFINYLIVLIIIIILISGCINTENNTKFHSYNSNYEKIEVLCKYTKSNIIDNVIIKTFENSTNITIIDIKNNTLNFIYVNNLLCDDNLSRIESYLAFENKSLGTGIRLQIFYKIKNPITEKISNDKEKKEWEQKINSIYEYDKQFLDEYLFSVTSFLKSTFNIFYSSLTYGPKYVMEE